MTDDKPSPIEVEPEVLREIEEESEPAVAKDRSSTQQDKGASGGAAHKEDD